MSVWKDFKKFAFKGNVVDMAVGVIVGGAFGKIVTSLVNDIVMPPIGYLIGGVDFKELKIVLAEATDTAAESAILYGNFIQTLIDFFLVAITIFIFVSIIGKARALAEKKETDAAAAAKAAEDAKPKAPTEAELLTEIRDLLREKSGN